jgi:Domain of unknown function (DUF4251)
MKTLPVTLSYTLSLSLAFLLFPFFSRAQSSAGNAVAVKTLIDSGNYVFRATSATSMEGRVRQLETDYMVTVTKDKITVDLPYYGEANSAPLDPTENGIQMTSTAFDYSVTPRKKDGWNVKIKPKDGKDVQQITLTISSEGYVNAQVISRNRQPINFSGVISAPGRN